ncbi:MAG: hypothetical protein HY747_12125 [Elusimicrobia bacterium]|nr:hypothetical protein [Elusimicrobiota bacterium]
MRRFLFIFFAALAVPALDVFALDSANLELSIAVPNPVTAGDTVDFQGIAVNLGSEEWLRDTYFWEAEVFDADKKYIAKTDRQQGEADLKPGESAAASLTFQIPANFGGFYFFRLYLAHNETRLTQSDYVMFRVIERPIVVAAPPPKAAVGGSFILAYQSPDLADARAGQASTILNLVGKASEGTYLLNSHNIHDSTSPWKPYILLGSYNTARGTVNLGDVSPNFSPLTLVGQGMRGLEMVIRPQSERLSRTGWSLVAGRTISALSAGSGANGRYERLVYAGQGSADFLDQKLRAGAGLILGMDNTASLSPDPKSSKYRGAALLPQGNQVMGLTLGYKPISSLDLGLDFSQSQFTENLENPTPKSGTALQLQAAFARSIFGLRITLQRAAPNFVSFGAPGIAADRMTYGLQAGVQPAAWANVSANLSQVTDNLANDPKKTTSVQRTMSLAPGIQLPTQTRLSMGLSQNAAQGKPSTALNNVSQTFSFGMTQSYKGQGLSASLQNSQFKDLNKTAHDLDTNTLAVSLNLAFFGRLRLSLGNTGSTTKDKVDGHKRTSASQSASLNFSVIQNKLSGQVWGANFSSKDDGAASACDTASLTLNTEFTWQATPRIAATLGANQADKKDALKQTQAATTGVNGRISITF